MVLNRNDSQLILESLEKNNMFLIPLDDERKWYRYHHLFADLLKQRLHLRDKETVTELHHKACIWFERQNMFDFAIEHALAIQNHEKSIQLIGAVVEEMWENGQHAAILKYGNLLPEELIKKNPGFCLYYSWILIITGQIQKAEPFLKSAEDIVKKEISDKNSASEDVQHNKKLLGKIAVASAYLNSIAANLEKTFHYGKTAMENLSDNDPLWFSWGWYSIGIAETLSEHFNESIAAYENALAYGKKSGNIYLISTIAISLAYLETRMGLYTSAYKKCSDLITFMKESGYSQIADSEPSYAALYSCMAGIECMRLDFDDAYENIKIAYNLSRNDSNNSYKVTVLLVYTLILTGRADYAGILKLINEIEEIIRQNKIAPGAMAIYVAMKGGMLIEQQELEKAGEFFSENGLSTNNKISYLDDRGYFSFVLLLITQFKFIEAEKILSELQTMAKSANRIETLIDVKIFYAILNKEKGNKEKAVANLIEAFEFALDDQILMSFIMYYPRINDLLREIFKMQETSGTTIPKQLTGKLKLAIEKREKLAKINSESGLSDRELDTLKLIAENLSNQEIAGKLFISLNTAKTHVRNILQKLEVENRSQAVNKAKEQGII